MKKIFQYVALLAAAWALASAALAGGEVIIGGILIQPKIIGGSMSGTTGGADTLSGDITCTGAGVCTVVSIGGQTICTGIAGPVAGDFAYYTAPTVCAIFHSGSSGYINYNSGGAPTLTVPGSGVDAALKVNVGSAGAVVVNGGAGGTPSSLTLTNADGTAASLTAGHVTTNANLTGDVTSSGNATTLAANAVTSSKMAVVNTRRVCDITIGDTSGSAITNAQLGPQKRVCFVPAAATIVEMDVAADAGTPNVIVGVNHAGSISNIVSSALATASSGGIACSKGSAVTCIDGATTASATLQNTSIAAGDYLDLVSGTAGGTAKLMTIHVVYTVN